MLCLLEMLSAPRYSRCAELRRKIIRARRDLESIVEDILLLINDEMKDLDLLHKLLQRIEKIGARISASLELLALKVKIRSNSKMGSHSKVEALTSCEIWFLYISSKSNPSIVLFCQWRFALGSSASLFKTKAIMSSACTLVNTSALVYSPVRAMLISSYLPRVKRP
jgi:hypothetical protein